MKQMRKYFVYIDDGKSVNRISVPAESEQAARAYCSGNSEIIAVKDVTEDYCIPEDAVWDALETAGFRTTEVCFMCRALSELGIIG